MDYYDGNTVTAFWNYAQRYAMSDNSFSPTFGPSAPGAVTSSPATPGTST
jgi:phospholipase C